VKELSRSIRWNFSRIPAELSSGRRDAESVD
jgi:hypothetical protein